VEKTAEQAIAEIEEKEKTQEIKKEAVREIKETAGTDDTKPDGPTRRRLG
jgi:hypothetical protein